MDPKQLQVKVQDFAQRLLHEASDDPIRALGLLVLILNGPTFAFGDRGQRLMVEVQKALLHEERLPMGKPVQHLAGAVTWEGVQHCLRCAKLLRHDGKTALSGYIYEIGPWLTMEDCDNFDACA